MSDIVIRCEGISKRYEIWEREPYLALRDTLTDVLYAPARRLRALLRGRSPASARPRLTTFWALQDVSFDVRQGEVLGIIGRNGAGKSTLLKILSRITKPTQGRARIRGSVGSLLEVGTGFHPELTGRENVYLNGAILGMRKAEIDRKFDEIVTFAEVERFIDTPVKRYSSGMYVRLAFAVAAHLEPEILLVDEVLAVGDAAFQKKCLGKMGDVAKAGRTILFVSHNMTAVQSLCSRAIWLQGGQVLRGGDAGVVATEYLQTAAESCLVQSWPHMDTAPGNDDVRIQGARVLGLDGGPIETIDTRTAFALEFTYWNLKEGAHLNLSVSLYDQEGHWAFTTTTVVEPGWHGRAFPVGLFRSVCEVPANLLNDRTYRVRLMVVQDLSYILYTHEDIVVFDVLDSTEGRGKWHGKWLGVVRPELSWSTERLEPASTRDLGASVEAHGSAKQRDILKLGAHQQSGRPQR
jgi:lipopolysaccharide transport system ATP-binding protein